MGSVGDIVGNSVGVGDPVAAIKFVGDGLGGIIAGAAVFSGFTNPAEVAAGNSFVLQAINPRTRINPRRIIFQRFKFLRPLLPLQILRMRGE